ncbi:hypothetical protein [Actinomycetospora termitidis]|uniref:DUF3137 domain-containing protein n=1 Tax=Actinomycetospora termitidis TaxID=3053470 RepID=A0ABT7M3N0_9PSEU|nr:hypothetical protein [Actinomycetospora sp. Odt1-22]MDL5155254.1 hypothetical protein [Actinomycetospora sp. Odt1-22]
MTIRDDVLPPTDAPFIPGDGPLFPRSALSRARERGWLRWWWASAGFGVLGLAALVAVFLVEDRTPAFLLWFGCWLAAIGAMVPGYRLGWAQRHDRYDDELSRYAGGVRAEFSLPDGAEAGAVRLAGCGVADTDQRRGRRVVRHERRTFALEESVLGRTGDGTVETVALRLAEETGGVAATARGERRGDLVDWTLDLPLGELRLRQRLHAVPSRRTLLDRWGRAWRVRADADATYWDAELPTDAGPVDAVMVTWFLCHLDAVGLDRCYRPEEGSGPARTAADGTARHGGDARWVPVGAPACRPDIPKAEGGGVDF